VDQRDRVVAGRRSRAGWAVPPVGDHLPAQLAPAAGQDPPADDPDPRFRVVAAAQPPPALPGPGIRLLRGVRLAEVP
jgi:hypothetical protein